MPKSGSKKDSAAKKDAGGKKDDDVAKKEEKDGKDGKEKKDGLAKDKEKGKDGSDVAKGGDGTDKGGKASASPKERRPVADVAREVWGELPWQKRLEMDALPGERMLPRYEKLLRKYYRTINDDK